MIRIELMLLLLLIIAIVPGIQFEKRTHNVLFGRDDIVCLKGVAAFFIIVAHIYLSGDYGNKVDAGIIAKAIGVIFTQLGGVGVLLFFFFSGYGIQEGYGNIIDVKKYLFNRIKKVYIPYVYIKFVFLLYELAESSVTLFQIPRRILKICTLEDWFIRVLVLEYFFYYVARRLNYRAIKLIVFLLISNALMAMWFIYTQKPARFYNSMWLFAVGVAFSVYQERLLQFVEQKIGLVIFTSVILFMMLGAIFAIYKGAHWCELCKPLSGVFQVLFVAGILRYIKLSSPILVWGGKKSLYLYIVHVTLMSYFVGFENLLVDSIFLILTFIIVFALHIIKMIIIMFASRIISNMQENKI